MSLSNVVATVVVGSGVSGPVPGVDVVALDPHTQPHPPGMVDSVRRPGFNGRAWVGRPISGEAETYPHVIDAERYGAWGHEDLRILVQVEGLFPFRPVLVGDISPWQPVRAPVRSPAVTDPHQRAQAKLARRLEEQRQRWLRENNFVGGVRTFGGRADNGDGHASRPNGRPQPRATIVVPEGLRQREEMKFRVDGGPGSPRPASEPAAESAQPAVWISLPPATRIRTVVAPAEPAVASESAESVAMSETVQEDARN